MSRPRKRFCPKGHDKDAPNGSKWHQVKTLKGTITHARSCAECDRALDRLRNRMKPSLTKDILAFLSEIIFTISYRPTKDKAAELIDRIRERHRT